MLVVSSAERKGIERMNAEACHAWRIAYGELTNKEDAENVYGLDTNWRAALADGAAIDANKTITTQRYVRLRQR